MQNDLMDLQPGATHPSIDQTLIESTLMQYFNHDLILLPFFFDEKQSSKNHKHIIARSSDSLLGHAMCGCSEEKRAILVSVKVLDNQVDLFDKDFRDNDNHDISNTVLHVMDLASNLQKMDLNEDLIDADIINIPGAETDEQMLALICYIAESFTFGKEPDLDNFDPDVGRKHIADTILSLFRFN